MLLQGLRRRLSRLAYYSSQIRAGRAIEDLVGEFTLSREGVVHAARHRYGLLVDDRTDEEFITEVYREVLGREADASGRTWVSGLLRAGASRQKVTLMLASSEEYLNRQWAARMPLQDLRELRPDSFVWEHRTDGSRVEVFRAAAPEDLDWMEWVILKYGYYEKPGIWSLEIDEDKRRMGALLGLFAPQRALEIGCSSGAVLACLAKQNNIVAEGLEISQMAIRRADPRVRQHIIQGDLLSVDLQPGYDLIFGLDVFEHLNPNRFAAYLARLTELIDDDGFLFINSPAFGHDPVYGTVFSLELPSWQADAGSGRLFHDLLVDADGYPAHGHLIWASSSWWTDAFGSAGFHRQVDIEKAVHRRYDPEFEEQSVARKAFFVFSRAEKPSTATDIISRFVAMTLSNATEPATHWRRLWTALGRCRRLLRPRRAP